LNPELRKVSPRAAATFDGHNFGVLRGGHLV
jgi:hypothetical protein